ncbi:MAG: hypothetical protein EP330_18070 [Deltaproteobacteria bacterium]|nr:MAG: hypothetical protein EP330_18070 [Deltaproteobacteria bacterium]
MTTVADDYSTGSFATVSLDDWTVSDELFVTSGDPTLAASGDAVYQINRYGYDTIRKFAPGSWTEPVWEKELADNSNPHAAVECGGSLFISLYETSSLAVHDPATGNLQGTVDLSAYDDGDGVGPEPSSLAVLGDKLYVGLQRLDRNDDFWSSVGGRVVEVDCATRTATQSWNAGGSTKVAPWGDDKLLVLASAFDTDPGGIYSLEPSGAGLTHLLTIEGEGLGSIAAAGDKAVVTSTASDYSHFGLHCVDLSVPEVSSSETGVKLFGGAKANDRGEAWVTLGPSWLDSTAPTGLVVYDIATCSEQTETPIATSLAPNAVSFY